MKRSFLIISISLMIVGLVLFTGVMAVYGFDFRKLSTLEYRKNSFSFDEKIDSVSIETFTSDVFLYPSDDSTLRVEVYEEEKMPHKVKILDGVLTVTMENHKDWYDYVGINFDSPYVKIYLPKNEYDNLNVEVSTGDIEVSSGLIFDDISVEGKTGDVRCFAESAQNITITISTGDILISGTEAGNICLSQSTGEAMASRVLCNNFESKGSTGDIELESVMVEEKLFLLRDTGDIEFEASDAGELYIKTSTGDVEGSLLSEKFFDVQTSTGDIEIPKSGNGGKCEIRTSTGDVEISIR